MAKRRVGFMVVASWALATLITGFVVWRAVAVLDDGTRTDVLSGPQVSGLLASASATPSPSAAGPSSASPPAPATTAAPTAPATTAGGPATTSKPATAPATTKAPATSAPGQVVRTWTVTGGVVSVGCIGQVISVLSASPQDGWRVKIESGGPIRIKVEFTMGEKETKVAGSCVGGVPQQSVSEDD